MLFRVGKVSVSTAILESSITPNDLIAAFERYIHGDWGDLDGREELNNDLAIADGTRIVANYQSSDGIRFCIETEAGRTTIELIADEPLSCTA